MRHCNKIDQRISFYIVTEENMAVRLSERLVHICHIPVVSVPASFSPPKAKYKARALEYFRIQQRFTNADWILHLDEETYMDEHAVRACIDAIERGEGIDFAQVGITCAILNIQSFGVLLK